MKAQHRAIASATLMVLACIATIAVVTIIDDNAEIMVEEMDKAPAPKGEVDVLKNIIKLKSYCLAAWDDARQIHNLGGRAAAMVEFVNHYGQTGTGADVNGKKAEVGNIVTEYAQLMGSLKAKYGGEEGVGINLYILKNIDHAIRTNPKGVVFFKKDMEALDGGGDEGHKYGQLVVLDYKALGMTDRPTILVRMAAPYTKYLSQKARVAVQSQSADTVAAMMFLKSKSYGHYTSFLQREMAKVQRRMRQEFSFVAKASYNAEKDAFKRSYEADREAFFKHVSVQAPAGTKAAKSAADTRAWQPPSYEEMKKIAAKNAKAFMKKFKAKTAKAGDMIKEITEEAGGVKLFISTTGATNSASTMKPEIRFIGTQGDVKGKIRTVPGPNSMFVQHYPVKKALGKVLKIYLDGEGTDKKWNGASIKVRVGGPDKKIVPFKCGTGSSFWLKSGQQLECIPDTAKLNEVEYEKAQCQGWKATQSCSGKGSPDSSSDKECTAPIDSSMSGYCQCDSGARAKVDCGHDTFTCNEICAA